MLACVLTLVEAASAAQLWSDGKTSLRLDTTIQFTALRRLTSRQSRLVADPNSDDSDRNFSSGDISDRTDIFSELDADYGTAGLRVSGAGWYDPVYRARNANDSPATSNPATVAHNRFTRAVRGLEGLNAELLDGFVHDTFNLGGTEIGLRLGRHTLIWGESLFFGENGVAVGQAPIDFIKASTVPNTLARELFLPVNQISASIQLRPGLSIEAYDQLEWRKDRLPGAGSYFSATDILDAGGERVLTEPGHALNRAPDQKPGATGQFGAALHATFADMDLGLYALRYNARSPAVTTAACLAPCTLRGQLGTYRLVYARGIDVFGASASTFLGDANLAGEISLRHAAPLLARVSPGLTLPRGNTAHAQLSLVAERPATALWDQATLQAELAANILLSTTAGRAARDPTTTRAAAALQGQVTLDYFHVRPGLDLSPFAAIAYGLAGRSSIDADMVSGTGNVAGGLRATYRRVWHAQLLLTAYLGSAGRQPLADRNFIAFNVRRSF